MFTLASFRPMLFRLLLIAVPLLALLSVKAEGADNPLSLQSVSADQLASVGITLKDPGQVSSTTVSAEAAVNVPGVPIRGPVREVKLARVIDKSQVPALDRVLWVVSRGTDASAPPSCFGCGRLLEAGWKLQSGGFALTFVDPYSGKEVSSLVVGGGMIPPEGWPPEGWSSTGFD